MGNIKRLRQLRWASIGLLAIVGLLTYAEQSFVGDRYSHAGSMIYPLFMYLHSPSFPVIEVVLAILAAVGLLFTTYQQSKKKGMAATLLLVIMAGCLGAWSFGLAIIAHKAQPTQLDRITHENQVYYLVADPCYLQDSVCPPPSYQVFQCDQIGVICRLYDIPFEESRYQKPVETGNFVVDPTGNKLYVQIGSLKYPVVAKSSFSSKPRS